MVPGRISTVSIIYWELHSRKAHFYHILPHSALPVVHTHTTHSPKVALTCLKGYERVATLFEALFFDSYIFGIKSSTKIWTLFHFSTVCRNLLSHFFVKNFVKPTLFIFVLFEYFAINYSIFELQLFLLELGALVNAIRGKNFHQITSIF